MFLFTIVLVDNTMKHCINSLDYWRSFFILIKLDSLLFVSKLLVLRNRLTSSSPPSSLVVDCLSVIQLSQDTLVAYMTRPIGLFLFFFFDRKESTWSVNFVSCLFDFIIITSTLSSTFVSPRKTIACLFLLVEIHEPMIAFFKSFEDALLLFLFIKVSTR